MMPPRATLTMRRPGLALARSSASTRPTVSGVLATWMVTKSDSAISASRSMQLDRHLAGPFGRHEGVVGDQTHAEGQGPLRDQLADAPEPDDAEGLVGQLDAGPLAALPATRGERGVCLGHVAGLGQQQRHRVLGGRQRVGLGCVDDHDAVAGGRVDVDVVEADARPTDDHQAHPGGQDVGGDRRGRSDDERVRTAHGLEQLVGRQAELHVDLVAGSPQLRQTPLGDLFGDQDARHGPKANGDPTRFVCDGFVSGHRPSVHR